MKPSRHGIWASLCSLLLWGNVHAGAVYDGSMGTQGTLSGNFTIPDTAGMVVGNNLFHSFSSFDVLPGESATFTGAATIRNIIARVTGGAASNIQGTIDTATFMPQASLYLLNPAGVMIGNGATLNIAGGIHVSTADYLRMADNTQFFSRPVAGEVLSTAAPMAFGFVNGNIGSIQVANATLDTAGGDISLTASNLSISSSTLRSSGGNMLLAAQTAGEISLGGATTGGAPSTIQMQSSTLDSSSLGAGAIVIRGGRLWMDRSLIQAGSQGGNGAAIDMQLTDAQLTASQIRSDNTGWGAGSGIGITTTNALTLDTGSRIESLTQAGSVAGTGGDITIRATAMYIRNGSGIASSAMGTGLAGNIQISGNSLELSGASRIGSDNMSNFSYAGAPGNIQLDLTNRIDILSASSIDTQSLYGRGGDITLRAANILQMDQGAIGTQTTFALGLGNNISLDSLFVVMNASTIGTQFFSVLSLVNASSGSNISLITSNLAQWNGSLISAAGRLDAYVLQTGANGFTSMLETTTNDAPTSHDNALPPLVFLHQPSGIRWGHRPCWTQGDTGGSRLVVTRMDAATTLDGWAGSPLPRLTPWPADTRMASLTSLDATPMTANNWISCSL